MYCCLFQSTGLVIYLVPQPTEVYSIHSLAQLQVGDPEGHSIHAASHYYCVILLLYAWIHGKENDGCINSTTENDDIQY